MTKTQRQERELAHFVSTMLNNKKTINDNLRPIESIYHLKKVKFDRHSPRFVEAYENLGIDKEDLILKVQ